MTWDRCAKCDWELSEPGLGEALLRKMDCMNCGHDRPLTEAEVLEIGQNIDQRLHMLEQAVWPLGK